ncbi:TonB-dependent receptor [Novosphingobium taihuense]|uniref:Iron complex outermembrane receptor protein n=1 Tax=Novosphingobium taihuense TaxID=260085 RepID=A0A7W7ETW1_9SPHN|nr:TonB-dependent receptor [Novosphingobium taihuense]MBB4613444.1 iron complex outermembrane receptor protein [Novosphingobium taihuense]TWH80950.1 iron complex outermembrane receptor protein [Novosphingobium taihuense]
MRLVLLGSTALIAVAIATPVAAQEAQADAGAADGITEIIVTAQRKEESLQKAAIAIDAVSGDDLVSRGITNATDITKAVPALSLPSVGGNIASIFIRGVGNVTNSSYNDPAVTPSYDGVVLGRGGGVFGAAFYDLARVEVLKGPQGILYGRNATGGAVNIIPARPEVGRNSMGFNLSYGNYEAVDTDAHVNLGVSENSALRLGAAYTTRDGYNIDGTDDARRGSLRAQFLIEPSRDLSLRIGADYTHVGGKGVGGSYVGGFIPGPGGYTFVPSGLGDSEGFNSPASNAFRSRSLAAPAFAFLNPMNADQRQDSSYFGVNAELNWQTGIGKLTVIPAYRESTDDSLFYGPAFNTAHTKEKVKQASFEARLSGSAGMVDYVLGAFYFNEKIKANNEYNQEFVLPILNYAHKTNSYAGFGQLTAHVTDKLRLIGGVRYTHDKKSIDGLITNFITFCGGPPPALVTPPASFGRGCAAPGAMPHYPNFLNTVDTINWLKANNWISATSTDQPNVQVFPLLNGVGAILKTYKPVKDTRGYSRVTWKASAEYDVTPDNLVYATVESGYRAGGLQMTESRTSYKPEYITSYTIGSKNRFFDNHVQLNLEGFIWKYRDQQITYFTVDTSGTLINSNENAGKSSIKGFDVDLVVKPTSGTTLGAKVQYLDSKYDDLHLFTAAPRDNFGCPFTFTGATAGGAPVKDFNCSGNPLLFSPKWTLNLSGEQVVAVGDSLELVANVDTAWRDAQWGAFEYLDFERIPAYWTTDASLTLRDADGTWALTGFVRNIEDKRRNLAPQAAPIGVAVGHFSAPRTYGLRLSGNF